MCLSICSQVFDTPSHKIVINEDGINSLIISATAASDAGQYVCIARNRGGEDRFTVHLNVIRNYPPPPYIDHIISLYYQSNSYHWRFKYCISASARREAEIPRFIERMCNQTVREGHPVSLTASATGVPVPMMSWSKDGHMLVCRLLQWNSPF